MKPPKADSVDPTYPYMWRSIWSLQIPPKLRFFLWRLCHRILPSTEALRSREKDVPLECQVCHDGPESIEHIFYKCLVSKMFYIYTGIHIEALPHTHPTITWRAIASRPILEQQLWVLSWWRIWKSRNWVVFEYLQYSMPALHMHLICGLDEVAFLPPLHPPSSPRWARPPPIPLCSSWRPPSHLRLKINVDGATSFALGGEIGLVVRDHSSAILFATGITYPGITNSLVLELLAFRDACALCSTRGLSCVDIEGGATLVTSMVSN
ncbi:hypothetical protein LINPERHAP2_LOCUS7265 [Linum perenne]